MKQKYFPGMKIGPDSNILYKQKIDKKKGVFICPFDGKEFIAYLSNITAGKTRSCGCLRKETARKKAIEYNHSRKKFLNKKNQRFGNCIVLEEAPEYKRGHHTYWKCLCDCEEIFYARTDNLCDFVTTCCPKCSSSISHGELIIKTILENNNIRFIKEKTERMNDSFRKFDFYLLDYNCYIEYDGAQHFDKHFFERYGDLGDELFQSSIIRDNQKNKWCFRNNKILIRIPYTHLPKLCLEDLLPQTSSFVVKELSN